MSLPIIHSTERLALREVRETDADAMVEIFSDPDILRFYSPRNRKDILNWIRNSIENYQKHGHGKWMLLDRTAKEVWGYCGLVCCNILGVEEVDLGYVLKRSRWGNGYATEAAAACLQLANERFGCKRVVAIVDQQNVASKNVAIRIGMTFEKTINDRGSDSLLFAKNWI